MEVTFQDQTQNRIGLTWADPGVIPSQDAATYAQRSHRSTEVVDADLGDARLTQRLGLLIDSLATRSGESLPKALDDAELEGAYRFFGNEKVTSGAILAPHFRQTARCASSHRDVLVAHDTTRFEFGGDSKREGLGGLIRPGWCSGAACTACCCSSSAGAPATRRRCVQS